MSDNQRTSGTTDPGDRSAADIERDVERARARLTGTVEELKERVSPGQLAEQAMDWMRGSGGSQFASNLGTTLRDNPMPVLLIAAGIGWMALSGGRDRSPRRWEDDNDDRRYARGAYAGEDYSGAYAGESYPPQSYTAARTWKESASSGDAASPSIGERASEAVEGLRDKAADLANRVTGTASGAVQGATDTARGLADSAAATGQQAARRVGSALQGASDRASEIGDRAYRYGAGAGRSVTETLESQPLLLGALGLAIGAALGALVPHSAAEDRLMGESRDRVADRLSSLAGEAYGKAREVVGEQAERAQETLGEAYGQARESFAGGVSPKEGASALGGVARNLREAVERTAQDAAQAVREATAAPEGEPNRTPPARPTGSASTGMPGARSGPESGGPV